MDRLTNIDPADTRNSLQIKRPRTLLFIISLVSALIVYGSFIFGNKMYVYTDCNMDTFLAYIPTYEMLADYLRNGFEDFPMYFVLGLGNDISYTLQGNLDPFSLVLIICGVIFGKASISYLLPYIAMVTVILRAQICYKFLELHGVDSYGNILASFCFAFSGYLLGAGQHYQFATMSFYVILELYMLERFIREDRHFVGVTAAFTFLFIRSIYYFYMTGVIIAFYFLLRVIATHSRKEVKKAVMKCVKVLLLIGISFGMSAFVTLNEISTLGSSSRLAGGSFLSNITNSFSWHSLNYDYNMFIRSLSEVGLGTANDYRWENSFVDPHLFMGIICVFSVITFVMGIFTEKRTLKNRILLGAGAFLIVFSLINNFVPSLVHVFVYSTYRFTISLMPYFAYVIGTQIPRLEKLDGKSFTVLSAAAAGISAAAVFTAAGKGTVVEKAIAASIILVTFALLFIFCCSSFIYKGDSAKRVLRVLLAAVVTVNMVFDGWVSVNVWRSVWTKDYYASAHSNTDMERALEYIRGAEGDNFFRVENTSQVISPIDYSFMKQYRSTSIYSSAMSVGMSEFKEYLGDPSAHISNVNWYACGSYGELFDVPTANVLGIKYITSDDYVNMPGWELVFDGNVKVYKNSALQTGAMVYSSFITKDNFLLLDPAQKHMILSQAAIVDGEMADELCGYGMLELEVPQYELLPQAVMLPMNMTESAYNIWVTDETPGIPEDFDISSYEDGFGTWYNAGAGTWQQMILSYSVTTDNPNKRLPIRFMKDGKEYMTRTVIADGASRFTAVPGDFDSFTVEFDTGFYDFDYFCLAGYDSTVIPYEGTVCNRNMRGNINAEVQMPVNGLLSIPFDYSEGWSAQVNGSDSGLIRCNLCFAGLYLDKGQYSLDINYRNKILSVGCTVSLISLLAFTVFTVVCKLRFKKAAGGGTAVVGNA